MAETVRCHAVPCRDPGHFVGSWQTPFCPEHWRKLTQLKRDQVLTIASFSVLELTSRSRAIGIINECRRYLAGKEDRKHA